MISLFRHYNEMYLNAFFCVLTFSRLKLKINLTNVTVYVISLIKLGIYHDKLSCMRYFVFHVPLRHHREKFSFIFIYKQKAAALKSTSIVTAKTLWLANLYMTQSDKCSIIWSFLFFFQLSKRGKLNNLFFWHITIIYACAISGRLFHSREWAGENWLSRGHGNFLWHGNWKQPVLR